MGPRFRPNRFAHLAFADKHLFFLHPFAAKYSHWRDLLLVVRVRAWYYPQCLVRIRMRTSLAPRQARSERRIPRSGCLYTRTLHYFRFQVASIKRIVRDDTRAESQQLKPAQASFSNPIRNNFVLLSVPMIITNLFKCQSKTCWYHLRFSTLPPYMEPATTSPQIAPCEGLRMTLLCLGWASRKTKSKNHFNTFWQL